MCATHLDLDDSILRWVRGGVIALYGIVGLACHIFEHARGHSQLIFRLGLPVGAQRKLAAVDGVGHNLKLCTLRLGSAIGNHGERYRRGVELRKRVVEIELHIPIFVHLARCGDVDFEGVFLLGLYPLLAILNGLLALLFELLTLLALLLALGVDPRQA